MSKEDYLSGKSFINTESSITPYKPAGPQSFNPPTSTQTTLPQYRTPLLTKKTQNGPRHDPSAPGAIVLPRVEMPMGVTTIDVVVDPRVAQCLRPHQKEGVKFLYECVMGTKGFNGRGAILADEMGLGKTLTVIALIWTLLSTFSLTMLSRTIPLPRPGSSGEKGSCCLSRDFDKSISQPARLTKNWKHEFRKWLGNERIGVLVIDPNTDLKGFTAGRVYQVMLIGYEKVVKIQDELCKIPF